MRRKAYFPKKDKSVREHSSRRNEPRTKTKEAAAIRRTQTTVAIAVVCVLLIVLSGFIYANSLGAFSPAASPQTVTAFFEESSSISEQNKSEPSAALPLFGKTVILDAGHGGYDNGCAYPEGDENPEYKEKDLNLQIAFEAKTALEKLGAEVVMTRTDDSFLSIYARPAMVHLYCLDYAKDHGIPSVPEDFETRIREELRDTIRVNSTDISDGCMGPMVGSGFSEDLIRLLELEYRLDDIIFISVHNNWNSKTGLHGTQVYFVTDESIIESENRLIKNDPYYSNPDYIVRENYYGRDPENNRALARFLHDSITGAVPELEPNLRELVEDNFAVLREQGLASVMLELSFVSNEEDRRLLSDEEIIRQMADGIAQGCIDYYNNR